MRNSKVLCLVFFIIEIYSKSKSQRSLMTKRQISDGLYKAESMAGDYLSTAKKNAIAAGQSIGKQFESEGILNNKLQILNHLVLKETMEQDYAEREAQLRYEEVSKHIEGLKEQLNKMNVLYNKKLGDLNQVFKSIIIENIVEDRKLDIEIKEKNLEQEEINKELEQEIHEKIKNEQNQNKIIVPEKEESIARK